jgi:hypothetical protein
MIASCEPFAKSAEENWASICRKMNHICKLHNISIQGMEETQKNNSDLPQAELN